MLQEPVGRIFSAADLVHPYENGMNLQIEVANVESVYRHVQNAGSPLLLTIEDKWYVTGEAESGNRQFVVQDPDGYLLRLFSDLGTRRGDSATEGSGGPT